MAPVRGVVKADYEDFIVEEVPLYPFSGSGAHVYVLIEKRGLGTLQAVDDVSRALNVARRSVGYAGLKDSRAVARQWLSIERVDPARVAALAIPRIRVLDVTRHGNKLRIGHLRANRFTIRVRQADASRIDAVRAGLDQLANQGVPNYFGEQRFGERGDTWRIGRALVHGRPDEAVDLLLGGPSQADSPQLRRARELYEAGRFADAARAWPGVFRHERRALKALEHSRGVKRRALHAVAPSLRRFYVSSYQSHLFNQVVARRLPGGLGRLWTGDLAWLHASGAVFRVLDADAEQPRADAFEISPTGPILGYRMTPAEGQAGVLEREVFTEDGLTAAAFRSAHLRVKGQRRPLRFRPVDPQVELGADGRGPYLELRFVLPRGCYATALLRELFSTGASEDEYGQEASEADQG